MVICSAIRNNRGAAAFGGIVNRPFILPEFTSGFEESFIMDEMSKSDIQALLNNTPRIPGNERTVQMLQNLMSKRRVLRDPFTYTALFIGLAAGANATFNINIQADSDFLIQAQAYHANTANAAQTASNFVYPLATVLLTDSGSGRQFMDAAVSIPAIFGNGQFPFVLPQPKLMSARSTLVVTAANYDAAAAYNLRLYFIGVKLFAMD